MIERHLQQLAKHAPIAQVLRGICRRVVDSKAAQALTRIAGALARYATEKTPDVGTVLAAVRDLEGITLEDGTDYVILATLVHCTLLHYLQNVSDVGTVYQKALRLLFKNVCVDESTRVSELRSSATVLVKKCAKQGMMVGKEAMAKTAMEFHADFPVPKLAENLNRFARRISEPIASYQTEQALFGKRMRDGNQDVETTVSKRDKVEKSGANENKNSNAQVNLQQTRQKKGNKSNQIVIETDKHRKKTKDKTPDKNAVSIHGWRKNEPIRLQLPIQVLKQTPTITSLVNEVKSGSTFGFLKKKNNEEPSPGMVNESEEVLDAGGADDIMSVLSQGKTLHSVNVKNSTESDKDCVPGGEEDEKTANKKVRKFVCKECGKKYRGKAEMEKHMNTVHDPSRPFPCILCGYRYETSSILKRHMSVFHVAKYLPD